MVRQFLPLAVSILLEAFGGGACGGQIQRNVNPAREPGAGRDSVLATGHDLNALVVLLDRYGRPAGQLPATLEPVLQRSDKSGRDIWGTAIRYLPNGLRYELRSAGRDRTFDTADDVVFTGQLGRNRPCEARDESGALTYDGVPICSPDQPIVVLPLCERLGLGSVVYRGEAGEDRVAQTGRMLVRIARRTDALAREVGGLPPNLRQVAGPIYLVDGWKRAVRYRPSGTSFEVRSGGRDGVFDNDDDVVVRARLAHTIPCEFTGPQGTGTCPEPPPPCPEAS